MCFLITLGRQVNHGKPYWFGRSQFKGKSHDGYHWQMLSVRRCYALRCYISFYFKLYSLTLNSILRNSKINILYLWISKLINVICLQCVCCWRYKPLLYCHSFLSYLYYICSNDHVKSTVKLPSAIVMQLFWSIKLFEGHQEVAAG